MKKVIITCIERGKVKTYTGELISDSIGGVTFAYVNKGSKEIKQIKNKNICNKIIQ